MTRRQPNRAIAKFTAMRAMHERIKNMTDEQVKLFARTLIFQREAEGEGKDEG